MLLTPSLEISLVILIVAAVICDFSDHLIPNAITLFAAAIGFVGHLYLNGLDGASFSLEGLVLGLILLMPFYLLGGMGGGDVKMMGAIGSFVGPQAAVLATGMALIFGGLMAVFIVLFSVLSSMASLDSSGNRLVRAAEEVFYLPAVRQSLKRRFPYAFAIGLGGLASLCYLRF
jgi:prepilin peptidase CpaA